MLHQINLIDSEAAMCIAEEGIEAIKSIKTDDFVEQYSYQVIALLPCQAKLVNSCELYQIQFQKKIVLVIFQQVNMKLINCANIVIHLNSSINIPALNISVAKGILLSDMQSLSIYLSLINLKTKNYYFNNKYIK